MRIWNFLAECMGRDADTDICKRLSILKILIFKDKPNDVRYI